MAAVEGTRFSPARVPTFLAVALETITCLAGEVQIACSARRWATFCPATREMTLSWAVLVLTS